MQVNDQYSIERIDQYNIALYKHGKRGEESKYEGKEFKEAIGYYSSVESACNKMLDLSIDVRTFGTIKQSITQAKKEIKNAINQHA